MKSHIGKNSIIRWYTEKKNSLGDGGKFRWFYLWGKHLHDWSFIIMRKLQIQQKVKNRNFKEMNLSNYLLTDLITHKWLVIICWFLWNGKKNIFFLIKSFTDVVLDNDGGRGKNVDDWLVFKCTTKLPDVDIYGMAGDSFSLLFIS